MLSIVIVVFGYDGLYGGHVPCGVTAHGSPGGPLQFDRLEGALAAILQEVSSKLSGETPPFRHLQKENNQ